MKMMVFVYAFTAVFFAGCAQQDDKRISDRAEIEGRAVNKAEQERLNKLSGEMEADLERRHRFYQAMSGEYSGIFTTASGVKFASKVKLIPSLPPYAPPNRIRTLEEVSSDLNNLYFNIQVLHWSPGNSATATGCVFQEVRGNLEKGKVDVAQAACPNVYSIRVIDPVSGPYEEPNDLDKNSTDLAQKILNRVVSSVDLIKVTMQPSNNAEEYVLELKREVQ